MSRRRAPNTVKKVASGDFGVKLRTAREAADLSLAKVASKLYQLLPAGYQVNGETIRRWETGAMSEAVADPVVLLALSHIYGVKISALSRRHAQTVDRIAALINFDEDVASLVTAE